MKKSGYNPHKTYESSKPPAHGDDSKPNAELLELAGLLWLHLHGPNRPPRVLKGEGEFLRAWDRFARTPADADRAELDRRCWNVAETYKRTMRDLIRCDFGGGR